jgi:hypothetical protein
LIVQIGGSFGHRGRIKTTRTPSRRSVSACRQERARAAARVNSLESLVGREDELWQRVETLVATRQQSDYDQAVQVIRDLRDAASRTGHIDTFVSRLEHLHTCHVTKISLLDRLENAGLLPRQLVASRTGSPMLEM